MKNDYVVKDETVEIYLYHHKHNKRLITYVDKQDLDKIKSSFRKLYPYWDDNARSYYCRGYAFVDGKPKMVQLHRFIMGFPEGKQIDHINHNPLDNRRDNLRIVDQYENQFNRRGAQRNNRSSGIRGITWDKTLGKWVASFQRYGKRKYLGYFDTIDEAKEALDNALKNLA